MAAWMRCTPSLRAHSLRAHFVMSSPVTEMKTAIEAYRAKVTPAKFKALLQRLAAEAAYADRLANLLIAQGVDPSKMNTYEMEAQLNISRRRTS